MKNIIALYNNPYNLLLRLKSYGLVFLGSLVLAIGYVVFIVPHHIVPGGIFGLSIVINQLGGLSVGITALIINIPLLLWGAKILGKETGFKTAFSMVMVSVLVDTISILTHGKVYVTDVLVSSIFGGVLIGLAVFIVMGAGATTGGNDILVRIISRWVKLPYSSLILIVDGVVVLLGVMVFGDFTMAAYCIIAIVSISKTIDHFLKKSNQNQTVLVFSKRNVEIKNELESQRIMENRIIKLIHHESNEKMILVTNGNKEIQPIEDLIYAIDPNAYISVLDSNYRV
jgi:uncharacterized membrane-anchored protein YitT (DUF2179 family)